jgi:lysozyme family protein
MQSVHQIAQEIVAREGGFVNDPDDPGGATQHGVTIHTLRRLGLDLDGDGGIDADDVRRVTPELAADLFLEHYYRRPRIDQLPEMLRASVFDMSVNAGSHAIRILQRLLNRMGARLMVDGVIGPRTLAAAEAAAREAPDHIADAYGIARRNYYYALADSRPASRKYARRQDGGKGGWIRRAEVFIAPRHHLTEAEHRARTAGWA